MDQSRADLSHLQAKINDLNKKLKEKEKAIDAYQNKIKDLESEIVVRKETASTHKTNEEQLKNQLAAVEAKLQEEINHRPLVPPKQVSFASFLFNAIQEPPYSPEMVALFENARKMLIQLKIPSTKPEFFGNPFTGITTAKQLLQSTNADFIKFFQAYNNLFPQPVTIEIEKEFEDAFNSLF